MPYPPVFSPACLPIFPPAHLSTCSPKAYLPAHLHICPPAHLHICQPACPLAFLPAGLEAPLSLSLSFFLSPLSLSFSLFLSPSLSVPHTLAQRQTDRRTERQTDSIFTNVIFLGIFSRVTLFPGPNVKELFSVRNLRIFVIS